MSESNIAYILVDMTVEKRPADIAMYQITELAKHKPQAWFVDIFHTAEQTPKALQLHELVRTELEARMPWEQHGTDAVTIMSNLNTSGHLRAKEKMQAEIAASQKMGKAQEVVVRDEHGSKTDIEF